MIRLFSSILVILFCLVGSSSCTKGPSPGPDHQRTASEELSDTIKTLDSIVMANVAKNVRFAKQHARKAFSIACRSGKQIDLIKAYVLLGHVFMYQERDSSFYFYNEALTLADSVHIQEFTPDILYGLAILYQLAQDYQTSLSLLDSAKNRYTDRKQFANLSNCYCAIGNIQYDLYDYQGAQASYDSALAIALRHQLNKQIGVAYANLSIFEEDDHQAIIIMHRAIQYLLLSGGGAEEEIANNMTNIGTRSPNPDSALYYFHSALRFGKQNSLSEVNIGAYNNMAYSYIDLGELDMAATCLRDLAIPLALQDSNFDWLSTLYDSYADVLAAKGDFRGAFTYERKSMEARMESDAQRAADQVRLLSALLNLKNKELLIQAKSRQLLIQESKNRQFRLWLAIAILVVTGLVVLVIILFQRNRLRMQKQKIASARRIIALEEREKQRLGRDLHDLTGQIVLGITGELERTDFSDEDQMKQLHQRIREIGDGIRKISHRLTRIRGEQLSFPELIADLCDNYRNTLDMKITLQMSASIPVLSAETSAHLFRIVQELLTNAGRYARESLILISIEKKGDLLELFYSDEGPGFEKEKQMQQGIGLSIIFERVNFLGGQADLATGPDAGTFWEISVPI